MGWWRPSTKPVTIGKGNEISETLF